MAPQDSGLAAPMLTDVAAAAEYLHGAGWPATFLIVFDELWEVMRRGVPQFHHTIVGI